MTHLNISLLNIYIFFSLYLKSISDHFLFPFEESQGSTNERNKKIDLAENEGTKIWSNLLCHLKTQDLEGK